jgi:lysozyme family protein
MTSTPAEAFAAWCAFLAPTEGGLSLDPADAGNWANGKLVGTKYGISAAAYPDLDIANLTLDAANAIRYRDYWCKVRGDELPGAIAFVLAEAAYGSGPGTAIKQMQTLVGVLADGAFGPATLSALMARAGKPGGIEAFVVGYESQRLLYEASLGTWPTYRVGWTRRMFGGTAVALGLDDAPAPAVREVPAYTAMLGVGRWLVTVEPA